MTGRKEVWGRVMSFLPSKVLNQLPTRVQYCWVFATKKRLLIKTDVLILELPVTIQKGVYIEDLLASKFDISSMVGLLRALSKVDTRVAIRIQKNTDRFGNPIEGAKIQIVTPNVFLEFKTSTPITQTDYQTDGKMRTIQSMNDYQYAVLR